MATYKLETVIIWSSVWGGSTGGEGRLGAVALVCTDYPSCGYGCHDVTLLGTVTGILRSCRVSLERASERAVRGVSQTKISRCSQSAAVRLDATACVAPRRLV